MTRGVSLSLAVLAAAPWACSAGQRPLIVGGASDAALVVAVTLGLDDQVLAAHGPARLSDTLSLSLPDEAQAIVAFALEPDEFVALDGQPLAAERWAGLRVVKAADGAGPCGSCAVPSEFAPALVSPGDRCAPPSFARAGAVLARGELDPSAPVDPGLVAAARAGLRLEWPGACVEPYEPLATERAPLVLCPWLPAPDPAWPEVLEQAPDGTVATLSRSGTWWTRTGPDGRRAQGRSDTGAKLIEDLDALAPGRWLVLSRAPRGADRGAVAVVDDEFRTLSTYSPPVTLFDLQVLADARDPSRSRVLALGRDNYGLGDPAAALTVCTRAGDELACEPPLIFKDECGALGDGLIGAERIGDYLVAMSAQGTLRVAEATSLGQWACLGRPDRRYAPRAGGDEFQVERLDGAHVLGSRLWACVVGGAEAALLTVALPPTSTVSLAQLAAAARVELIRLPGPPVCDGFVETADGVFVLQGDVRVRVEASGRVSSASSTIAPGALDGQISSAGSVWQDRAGRVFRAPVGRPVERLLGEDTDPGEIVALSRAGPELIAWRSGAPSVAVPFLDPQAEGCPGGPLGPRAQPRALSIAGMPDLGTLRAWTSTGAVAWAFHARPPLRWVRLDPVAGRVDEFPVQPDGLFDPEAVAGVAFLDAELAVVADRRGGLFRVRRAGDRAVAEPVALRPWAASAGALTGVPEWGLIGSAGGVAWVAAETGFARVTATSAELGSLRAWPIDQDRPMTFSVRSRLAGLVVLGPGHVLLSMRDDYAMGFILSRLTTHEIGPAERGCRGPLITDGLRVCRFPDAFDDSALTMSQYAPALGRGPGSDPVLVNRLGLLYGPRELRAGVGFVDPSALVAGPRGSFAIAGRWGRLVLGTRGP